jgi:hypothetical protein
MVGGSFEAGEYGMRMRRPVFIEAPMKAATSSASDQGSSRIDARGFR